jgi:hypothetical protein
MVTELIRAEFISGICWEEPGCRTKLSERTIANRTLYFTTIINDRCRRHVYLRVDAHFIFRPIWLLNFSRRYRPWGVLNRGVRGISLLSRMQMSKRKGTTITFRRFSALPHFAPAPHRVENPRCEFPCLVLKEVRVHVFRVEIGLTPVDRNFMLVLSGFT